MWFLKRKINKLLRNLRKRTNAKCGKGKAYAVGGVVPGKTELDLIPRSQEHYIPKSAMQKYLENMKVMDIEGLDLSLLKDQAIKANNTKIPCYDPIIPITDKNLQDTILYFRNTYTPEPIFSNKMKLPKTFITVDRGTGNDFSCFMVFKITNTSLERIEGVILEQGTIYTKGMSTIHKDRVLEEKEKELIKKYKDG